MTDLPKLAPPDRWLLLDEADWSAVQALAEGNTGLLGLRLRLELVRPVNPSQGEVATLLQMLRDAEGIVHLVSKHFDQERQDAFTAVLDDDQLDRVWLRSHRGGVEDIIGDLMQPDLEAYTKWVDGPATGPLGVGDIHWSAADAEAFERAFTDWIARVVDEDGLLPLESEPVADEGALAAWREQLASARRVADVEAQRTEPVVSPGATKTPQPWWAGIAAALRQLLGSGGWSGADPSRGASSSLGWKVGAAIVVPVLFLGLGLVVGARHPSMFGTDQAAGDVPVLRGGPGAEPVYVLRVQLRATAPLGPLTDILVAQGALLCGPFAAAPDGSSTTKASAATGPTAQMTYYVLPRNRSDRGGIRDRIESMSEEVTFMSLAASPCRVPAGDVGATEGPGKGGQ